MRQSWEKVEAYQAISEMIQTQQTHLLLVLWSSLPLALMARGAWWLWFLAGELFTPLDFSVILHVQPVSSPAREMAKKKSQRILDTM